MFRSFVGPCALAASILLALAASSSAQGGNSKVQRSRGPSLTSDQAVYVPGTLAILSGTGFLPNESITLHVARADGEQVSGPAHQPWTVAANDRGRFVTSWLTCEDGCIGVLLNATAYGAASGNHASTSLTENHDCGTGVVTSVTPVGGACSAFTPAVGNGPDNYEVQEGGTYVMTIEGVTECSGDTITVFVQSSSTGNFCFDAIGGSGTYSGTFTMPNPACNTLPISYKCGANASCNHPGSLAAQGPTSGCGGVHLRASNFDANCVRTGSDTDCAPPDPTGACCLLDGSCVQATEHDCLAQGGSYNGDGSNCGGVNCPQPVGSCCLTDGSCVQVTEDECSAQGGTYGGDGSLCQDASCPQPNGACCLVDGTCIEVTEEDCLAAGGSYNGDFSLCSGANCPFPAGACCLTDGSCVQVTANDCAALGGTYGGDGSMCKDASCPQPSGACCLLDGSCVQVTEEDCLVLGGTFSGDFTQCVGVSCPQPSGSCCLVDGSCVQVTEEECQSLGGTFGGDGSQCQNANCPQPTGACCLVDGSCAQVVEEECQSMGGTYHGDGSSCGGVSCPDLLPDCFVLGFDTDDNGNPMAHGAMVDAEFDCNGSQFPVAITGNVNFSGGNTAAILNSSTGPSAQDPDLLVGKGNILILQTDANLAQCPPNSGVYCSHNDDENGGTLSFAFCVPAIPSSIVLVDIDGTDQTSRVILTDVNGKTRTYVVPGNWTGDKVTNFPAAGWKVLSLTTLGSQIGYASTATVSEQAGYDPNAVVRIDVRLGGSGGVDDLTWCQ